MFSYTIKYTETEYDTQNNDLLYKYTNNAKIHSIVWKMLEKETKHKQTHTFILSYWYFVIFENVVISIFWDILYLLEILF